MSRMKDDIEGYRLLAANVLRTIVQDISCSDKDIRNHAIKKVMRGDADVWLALVDIGLTREGLIARALKGEK